MKLLKWFCERTYSVIDVMVLSTLLALIYEDGRWALVTFIIWFITCSISRTIDKLVDEKQRS